jgi:hypothetical protein
LGALASTHLRASARNAASCGVSSKFIGASLFCHSGRAKREPGISIHNLHIPGSPLCGAPE